MGSRRSETQRDAESATVCTLARMLFVELFVAPPFRAASFERTQAR